MDCRNSIFPLSDSRMPLWRAGVCMLMLLAGIAVQFGAVRFGCLDYHDESYQALNAMNWQQAPAAMLTFFIGHGWIELFGHQAIYLRCLGALGVVLALGAGALYYTWRTGNIWSGCIIFLVSCVVAQPGVFHIFNWDTGAYLFETLLLISALELWRSPRKIAAVAASAFSAACALARIQLIITLPLVIILAIYSFRRNKRSWGGALGLLCVSFATVWLLLTTWMCGSPSAYIDSFVPDNFISGHSLSDWPQLLWLMMEYIPDLPLNWLIITCAVISALFLYVFRQRVAPGMRGALTVLCCAWPVFTAAICQIYTEIIPFAFSLPLLIAVAAMIPLARLCRGSNVKVPWGPIVICLVAVALTGFGSDCWFNRYESMLALAPLCAFIEPRLTRGMRQLMRYILLMSLLAASVFIALRWTVFSTQRFTTDMSPLTYQHGLLGTPDEYCSWSAMLSFADAAEQNGLKVMYLSGGYGIQHCRPDGFITGFNTFHFKDSPQTAAKFAREATRADAVLVTIHSPEELPLIVSALEEQGFVAFTAPGASSIYGFAMIRADYHDEVAESFTQQLKNY